MRAIAIYESVKPDPSGALDSVSTDPNTLKQMKKDPQDATVHKLKATARIEVVAGAAEVHDLATRIFGECKFDPPEGVAAIAGEPVLYITPAKTWTMQRMMYFSTAMDRSTSTYKVSYVMPDKDHGPNSIKVCFFRGFRPSR